jgi:hypothetical protein
MGLSTLSMTDGTERMSRIGQVATESSVPSGVPPGGHRVVHGRPD